MASFAIYQYTIGTIEHQEDSQALSLEFKGGVDQVALPNSELGRQEQLQSIFDHADDLEFREENGQKKPTDSKNPSA